MIVIYRLNEPRVGKDGIGWVGQEPPGSYPKSHRAYNECTKCCGTTPMVGKQCCMYPWAVRQHCATGASLPALYRPWIAAGGYPPDTHPKQPGATRSSPHGRCMTIVG